MRGPVPPVFSGGDVIRSGPTMDDDTGVPLDHYLQKGGHGVLFYCRCGYLNAVPVECVVERLKASGLGDEHTGIRALARLSRRPCPRCGAVAWESRPGFPSEWLREQLAGK